METTPLLPSVADKQRAASIDGREARVPEAASKLFHLPLPREAICCNEWLLVIDISICECKKSFQSMARDYTTEFWF